MAGTVKGSAVGVVSKKEYAEHRGCSAAYVSKLIRQGKLAAPALMADGTINVALADQMLGTAPLLEPEAPPPSGGPSYSAERARREAAEAHLAELKLAQQRGETLSRSDVARATFDIFRTLRDTLQALPARHADELAAETDPRLLAYRLREVLNGALASVAAKLNAPPAPPTEPAHVEP